MGNEPTDTVTVTLLVEDRLTGKTMEQEWDIQLSKIGALSRPGGTRDRDKGNALVDGQNVIIIKGYHALRTAYRNRLKLSKFITTN